MKNSKKNLNNARPKESKDIRSDSKVPKSPHHVWKIVSIVFIIIFLGILAEALIRHYHFKSYFTQPTEYQANMTRNAAIQDLSNRGEDTSQYKISVSEAIKPTSINEPIRNIIEVTAYNDTVMHLYIVDANTGEILMHSISESYGFINYSNDRPPRPDRNEWLPKMPPRI